MNGSSAVLSHQQWLRVNEVILEWHSHTDLRTFPERVLAGLHRVFSADTASFADTRGGLRQLAWQELPAHSTRTASPNARGPTADVGAIIWTEFQRDFMSDREGFIDLYTSGPGHSDYTAPESQLRARRISDDVSLLAFRDSRVYSTCYAPVDRELSCSAPLPGGGSATCAVSRKGRDFSDEDVLVLETLRPHFALAYGRALTLSRANAASLGPSASGIEALRRLGISTREAEVLAWVAEGKTNPEISLILGIGKGTVKTHLENILRKLGCETRTAAARQAMEAVAAA